MLLAFVCVLELCGCSYPYRVKRGVLDNDAKMTFATRGPVSIDIESFNGDINIETDPAADAVTFRVQREAVHGLFRGGDASSALTGISYEADLVPGELGPLFKVRTWTTTPEPHYQRAHITIVAPSLQDVNIKTDNGCVRVVNCNGAVDITTREGDVVVMTNEVMVRPVTIVTSEGTIDYRVRGESTGRFDCETVRGEVKHRLQYGRFTMQPSDQRALRLTLNDGENPIRLRTVDGDIRIAVVNDPIAVGTFIIEP
jgi:hypothetical protein